MALKYSSERFLAGIVAVGLILTVAYGQAQPSAASQKISDLKITILSTMLVSTGGGIGEWGFSALVEADGQRVLVDTGGAPDTVLKNAETLGIDLSTVRDVLLTHNHDDHTS